MNSNPEWLMPPMGKQDVSPYDILIDLVPWYARLFVSMTNVYLLSAGHKYGNSFTSVLKSFRSVPL